MRFKPATRRRQGQIDAILTKSEVGGGAKARQIDALAFGIAFQEDGRSPACAIPGISVMGYLVEMASQTSDEPAFYFYLIVYKYIIYSNGQRWSCSLPPL
ncbi:hypothetical protein PVAP13_3KG234254 [Panicum virgatum]|uniref:Uncharacterized protein n=1 Tax=Panicum virgatum TaxID=38727 RepID=A0A8T0V471_PANVG|nr:hypothetical protein PVAP13_3KG234254 [Panicum virgatum]